MPRPYRLYEIQLETPKGWVPRGHASVWAERDTVLRKVYGGPQHFSTSKRGCETMAWFCSKYGLANEKYRLVRLEQGPLKTYASMTLASIVKETSVKKDGSYWRENPDVPGVISANGAWDIEMAIDKRRRKG